MGLYLHYRKSLNVLYSKLVLTEKINPLKITFVVITTYSLGPHTYKVLVASFK